MYADILREWYLCVCWLYFLSLSRSPSLDGAFASPRAACSESMVLRLGQFGSMSVVGVACDGARLGAVVPGGGPHSLSSVRRSSLSVVGVACDGARLGAVVPGGGPHSLSPRDPGHVALKSLTLSAGPRCVRTRVGTLGRRASRCGSHSQYEKRGVLFWMGAS